MPVRRERLHGLALLGLAWSIACDLAAVAPSAHENPRLVVLYMSCTVNKDYLAPYDAGVAYTPRLATFARDAAVFTNHQTESGLSGTSFASILSGTQADEHQVFQHPRRLDDRLHLIFEAFQESGFETFYWGHIALASGDYNYSQGVPQENEYREQLRGDDPRFLAILRRLESDPGYRVLVVSNFTVTHGPYREDRLRHFLREYPEERRGLSDKQIQRLFTTYMSHVKGFWTRFPKTARNLRLAERQQQALGDVVDLVYRSRVNYLDQLFGEVLRQIDESPVAAASLVAFTADHGETLYRKNRPYMWTHGPDLQPEVINVPLLIRDGTGRVAPGCRNGVTRSIDVYPTLAGLAGVSLPDDAMIAGVDLSPALRGEAPFPDLDAYSHGTLRTHSFVKPDVIERIRVSRKDGSLFYRWRPVRGDWRFEVFDHAKDPDADIYDPDDPAHRDAAEDLWRYRAHLVARYHAQNPDAPRSREARIDSLSQRDYELLRTLGYIDEGN